MTHKLLKNTTLFKDIKLPLQNNDLMVIQILNISNIYQQTIPIVQSFQQETSLKLPLLSKYNKNVLIFI